MDSLVLQTAIGLVFIFASTAALVSVVTESISHYTGLRSEYLLRGLRTMLDGNGEFKLPRWEAVTGFLYPSRKAEAAARVKVAAVARVQDAQARQEAAAKDVQGSHDPVKAAALSAAGEALKKATTDASEAATKLDAAVAKTRKTIDVTAAGGEALVAKVMEHPLVGATEPGTVTVQHAGDVPLQNKDRRHLPSYLSGRSFARALIDTIVPNADEETTLTEVREAIAKANISKELKRSLLAMADGSTTDVAAFRGNVEHWYDDQMARVSGWYKRHVRSIGIGIGIVLVLAFNLNVFTIARGIYTDEAVRGSVVTQAAQASKCANGPAQCLQELRANIDSARGAGLPVGWTKVQQCAAANSGCNWAEQRGLWVHHGRSGLVQLVGLFVLLLGWALMVLALLPGANFWCDILGRLGTLRASGPKPALA